MSDQLGADAAGGPEVPLHRCPICLTDVEGPADAVVTEEANSAVRCSRCRVPVHRECLGRLALAAAEDRGQVAVACPVPSCQAEWPAAAVAWALPDEAERRRYDRAVQASQELRASRSDADTSCELSPRSNEALRRQGIRQCPRCRALIQKQAEGLFTGCDKMTCRCGCMFCFRCNQEAAGGASRCRCVGAHHSFIPHSQVLGNYSGPSFFGDQDLIKQPRGNASKHPAAPRIRKELLDVERHPPPFVRVAYDSTNIMCWNFLIEGPPDTPFAGGWYWGKLELLKDYPFLPPLIRMLTPNGRFVPDSWMCRSVLDYSPDGWAPGWSLSKVLLSLVALLCEEGFAAGVVHPPPPVEERRQLARESLSWNRARPDFVARFPWTETLDGWKE